MTAVHKPWYIVLIVFTVCVYICTLVLNYLATTGPNILFHNNTGVIAEYFYLEIIPTSWTFAAIWILIYVWQTLWILYALSTIWRRTIYGYLYVNPAHIPLAVYPAFIVNNVTNLSWLIVWDRYLAATALVLGFFSTFWLYLALLLSTRKLYKTNMVLTQEKKTKDIWLTKILVHNGLAFYASWVTIATLINLCVVLTYDLGLDQSASSTIGLAMLAIILALWFFLEVMTLDNYVRYILTPYIVIIIALTGSLSKNWAVQQNNTVLTICLLAASFFSFIVKVTLTFWKHKTRPLFTGLPLLHESLSKSYGSYDYMEISVK